MNRTFIAAILGLATLPISARHLEPNTAPAAAFIGGHFDGQQEGQKATKDSAAKTKESPCAQCPNCCPVIQPQSKTKEEQEQESSDALLYRRYLWATILGVVGAWIGLAILIYQTWMSRQTSQRQLRAYVLSHSSMIANVANPVPLFPGQDLAQTDARITNTAAGPGAWIEIKNTGQTPAFKVTHWANICFREYPLTTGLPARLPIAGGPPTIILGPGMIATKLLELNPPLTPAQINDLRNATGAVYVYGEITYIDAFKKHRFTRYRVMYHRVGGAIGVSTNLNFCEEGNEAN